jgi:hypothetical protein
LISHSKKSKKPLDGHDFSTSIRTRTNQSTKKSLLASFEFSEGDLLETKVSSSLALQQLKKKIKISVLKNKISNNKLESRRLVEKPKKPRFLDCAYESGIKIMIEDLQQLFLVGKEVSSPCCRINVNSD